VSSLSHTVPYRVRFDESAPDGNLRTSTLLRYAQDAAWIHSESLGFDREWYSTRGLWWLVRCVDLRVLDTARMGETLSVTTTIVGYRKVWARRRTDLVGARGQRVAEAFTDWVITDERGMPTRVPEEFTRLFAGQAGTFTPARVALEATPPDAIERRFQVRPQDLDPMGHVNNAGYLDYLEEAVLADSAAEVRGLLDRRPRRYRLEYNAPAVPGAELLGRMWGRDAGVSYRLTDERAGVELLRATLAAGEAASQAATS